jgi:hypothetical protein
MRSAIISTAFAAAVIAAPVVERQAAPGGPGDGVILNYALTLEHLENAFYKEGLAKFSQADFAAAGYDNVFYSNLKEISSDEETHVSFLSGALTTAGVKPVVPNTYAFGFEDVKTFLTIANVLEGVGVSAYLGAAQFIADATYLTAAGSILTVEARHSAYLRSNQQPQLSPFPAPFDIPLDFNEVVTLAAPFITAIAPENGPLPVNGFPAITAAPGAGKAGDKIALTCAKDVEAKAAYFITITGSVEATLEGSGKDYKIVIPEKAPAGQSYVVLTKEKVTGTPSDDNIVAGPAIIEIADNQSGIIPDVKKCVDGKPEAPVYHPAPSESPKAPVYHPAPSVSLTTIYHTKVYTSYEAHPTTTMVKEHPVVYTTVVEHKPTKTEHASAPVYTTTEAAHAPVYPTTTEATKSPVTQIPDGQVQAPAYAAPPAPAYN